MLKVSLVLFRLGALWVTQAPVPVQSTATETDSARTPAPTVSASAPTESQSVAGGISAPPPGMEARVAAPPPVEGRGSLTKV